MRFEKVSRKQYEKDAAENNFYHKEAPHSIPLRECPYEDIKLPVRATKKSAGYDFFAPCTFTLAPGDTIKLATGIRVRLDDDKFLMCAPRSGHGFKARIQLDNTIGIIDADYYESSNEGHIHVKLTNDSHTGKTITVKKGEGMMQAIILSYFKVDDDDSTQVRDGGFGSTTIN